MIDGGTEDNRRLSLSVFHVGVYNKTVTVRNHDSLFKIKRVILESVDTNIRHIYVCLDADAAYWTQHACLDGILDIQFMCDGLKNLQQICTISSFRCCGQTKCKLRPEISQNPRVTLSGCMMALVNDKLIEVIGFKLVEITNDALNASADYK